MKHDGNAKSETPEAIFTRAAKRAHDMGLPYAGAVLPAEAYHLAQAAAAKILDVRTVHEYQQVGHVAGTPLVVWPRDGGTEDFEAFVEQVRESFEKGEPLLLLCRSGVRSHYAAHLLTHEGFERAYNILEGFEGASPGQGWRAAGLPWARGT
ncbi:MAG: rhodanese-like domain-containing protein [Usitatibacter sp.]